MVDSLPVNRSGELVTNPGEKFCLRRFTVDHRGTLEQSDCCLAPPLEPSGIGASLATLSGLVLGAGIIRDQEEPRDIQHTQHMFCP